MMKLSILYLVLAIYLKKKLLVSIIIQKPHKKKFLKTENLIIPCL